VVVDTLVDKCLAACAMRGVANLVITGGVAANRQLRAVAEQRCRERGIALHVPPPRACTDNAAMIAYAGAQRLARGERDLAIEISPNTALPRVTRKGRGERPVKATTTSRSG
jgi:N6-L-threonylcarbamoyladenine synthase